MASLPRPPRRRINPMGRRFLTAVKLKINRRATRKAIAATAKMHFGGFHYKFTILKNTRSAERVFFISSALCALEKKFIRSTPPRKISPNYMFLSMFRCF